MHSDVAVIKLKLNESELAKKKCSFLDYFFFYRSLKLVHLQLQPLGYTSLRRKKRYKNNFVFDFFVVVVVFIV